MTDSVDRDKIEALRALASEAESFHDPAYWGMDEDEDEKSFGREMRSMLERNLDRDLDGGWLDVRELVDFKKRQQDAGITNRELMIGMYGAAAFGHTWCGDPLHPNCPSRKRELAKRYSADERALISALVRNEQG